MPLDDGRVSRTVSESRDGADGIVVTFDHKLSRDSSGKGVPRAGHRRGPGKSTTRQKVAPACDSHRSLKGYAAQAQVVSGNDDITRERPARIIVAPPARKGDVSANRSRSREVNDIVVKGSHSPQHVIAFIEGGISGVVLRKSISTDPPFDEGDYV